MKKVLLIVAMIIASATLSMAQNTIDNAFFEQVPYVGAFGTDDWTAGWTNFNPQVTVYPSTTVTIPAGNLTSQTWSSGTSPVFNAADFTNSRLTDAFFTPTTYIGAFDGTNDWTEGWAEFNPQSKVYPATTITIPAGNISTNTTWSSGTSPVFNAADFTNSRLTDPFFTPTTYIGAFDGTNDWTAGWTEFDPQTAVYPPTTVTVNAGNISTNTTWTSGNVYLLNGFVYVTSGATLTIQAGTIIRGDKVNKGTIIVEKGGKIDAQGTSTNPIVFTSNQVAGSRAYGDWGGIILLGNAVINVPGGSATIEGGVNRTYGGTNDNDNSGTLKYCRIEYSGIAFEPNNEINGLTMGGVGDGTTLDYIQVSYNGDDAFEWFGGKVNAKHLVALGTYDDDFDTDFGYRGKIQFAVSLRDPAQADVSDSHFFESDNDGSGSSNTPITQPLFSNVSGFINGPTDPDYIQAFHLRRNTQCSFYNSIFTGYPVGLFIDGTAAQNNATNNLLQIENVIMAGMTSNYASTFEQNYYLNPARDNSTLTSSSALHIADPFNLTNPDWQPQVGSTVYKLDGFVYVPSGVTLTIEPGTVVRGDKTNKGTIIVEKGGKLIAEGTPSAPIVFTSNQAAGSRAYGDWGGIILLGNAVINVPGGSATIEGGVNRTYGGTNDNDNSGTLKYCRIEFSGIAFEPNNEINGLTMGGVGAGTTLDYIQVSYNGDDAFEWFGGFVNAKHLIAFRTYDDDFDTDFGYRGMIQFAVSLRDPAEADVSDSHYFESDNDGSGSTNTPITQPIFSNVSGFILDPTDADYIQALHLRRNTRCSVYNSILTGYPVGLFIDGTAAQNNATSNLLKIEYTIMADMTANYASTFEQNYFEAASRKNGTYADYSSLAIDDPYNLTNPSFMPLAGSPVLVRSYWTKEISGTLTYNNAANTPLPNVTLSLNDGSDAVVATATTDASGNYKFNYVWKGNYSMTASGTPFAFGGLSGADALAIKRHAIGIITLTGLRLTAADVNLSSTITGTDALYVSRRAISIVTPQWTAPDWIYESFNLSVSSSNISQNVLGLCSGDVNGSYTPTK
jgi:hypothetical protein